MTNQLEEQNQKDRLAEGEKKEKTPKAIETEKDIESFAEETVKKVESETKSTLERIKDLARNTIANIRGTVGEPTPESKEGRDYKEIASEYLEELIEIGFPEERGEITDDIFKGSIDEKIARILQIANVVAEKLPPIDAAKFKKELNESPEGESKAAFVLKKTGAVLTEAGVDKWAEDRLATIGEAKTKELIADNVYLKMTAVAAKKLLSLYEMPPADRKKEIDPETGKYKEDGMFKKVIKRGLPLLKRILDNAVTEEDEEEVKEFLGEKAEELVNQITKK